MEENEKAKGTVTESTIDEDILAKLKDERHVLEAASSQKELNRAILNAYAEMLAELKHMSEQVGEISNLVTLASYDKVAEHINHVAEDIKRRETVKRTRKKGKKKVDVGEISFAKEENSNEKE